MKIIAFGASSSRTSINKMLASYAANLVVDAVVEVVDLNDFELPIFSEDKEKQLGQPVLATQLFEKIGNADAIVISFAEHNASYSAAYKNTFDWMSRINMQVFQDKPMVLLATSPGAGGAKNVLASAVASAPYFAGQVKAQLSIPKFYDNFDLATGEPSKPEIADQIASAMAQI